MGGKAAASPADGEGGGAAASAVSVCSTLADARGLAVLADGEGGGAAASAVSVRSTLAGGSGAMGVLGRSLGARHAAEHKTKPAPNAAAADVLISAMMLPRPAESQGGASARMPGQPGVLRWFSRTDAEADESDSPCWRGVVQLREGCQKIGNVRSLGRADAGLRLDTAWPATMWQNSYRFSP
jgi:hypothetical protein